MSPTELDLATADVLAAVGRMPSPTEATLELQREARAGATPDRLAERLAGSPELTTRLARLADAGRLGTGPRARGARDVCRRLGARAVGAFALAADYADQLVASAALDDHQRQAFARRAVATAVAARSLARRGAVVPEEDAFLGGLLIGVGQLALATVRPDLYGPLLADDAQVLPDRRLEQQRLGFDHGPLDAAILEHWGLADGLRRAVSAAPAPERMRLADSDPTARALCELFHTALLAGSVAHRNHRAEAFLELRDALADRYALPLGGTAPFLRSLAPAMAEVSELLGFPAGPGLDLASLATEAADEAREWLAARTSAAAEDDERDWRPTGLPTAPDPLRGLLEPEHLRPALLEALARRGSDGRVLPCGLLLLALDADRPALGDEVHHHVRESDLLFRLDAGRVALLAPDATQVSLRAVGVRVVDALDREAAERGDAPVRAGGAAAVGTRRACEAELLVDEALEALERACADPEPRAVCRIAGLF